MSITEPDFRLLRTIEGGASCKKCDVRAIIADGANPTIIEPLSGLQPIHLAARRGSLVIVKALLEDARVYADAVDRRGKVPYEWAEEFDHTKTELFLVNTIIDDPSRYSLQSIREARTHLQLKQELAPA